MKLSNFQPRQASRHGFTIVEVIITFIIIGILATILIPVLADRSRQARIRACEADLQNIADALERAAIDTGYFYRIYALDDIGTGGDGIAATDSDDVYETISDNEITTNNWYENGEEIFILVATSDYAANQTALFRRLTDNETSFGWSGPYINWIRDANNNDWPDDPWGNDYLFFTRAGALYPPQLDPDGTGNNPPFTTDFSDGFTETFPADLFTNVTIDAIDQFDRPTVLSLGPDGLPGDGGITTIEFGGGDDIFRSFGGAGQSY